MSRGISRPEGLHRLTASLALPGVRWPQPFFCAASGVDGWASSLRTCKMRMLCFVILCRYHGGTCGVCASARPARCVCACKANRVCASARPFVLPRIHTAGWWGHTRVMYSMRCKCWQVESALWPDHLFRLSLRFGQTIRFAAYSYCRVCGRLTRVSCMCCMSCKCWFRV